MARNTQRDSQSFTEKRRRSSEIEITRRRKGGVKRGESNLASNQILKCSPQPGTPRKIQSHVEKIRGRKETEVARRIKGVIKRRETDPASNQFPKCSPLSRTHKEIHRVGLRREGGGRR